MAEVEIIEIIENVENVENVENIEEQEEDANAHLTPEQRAIVDRALSAGFEQGAHGFDLTLFRANLRRTPEQRLARIQAAHYFYQEVKKARANRISKSHRINVS